MKRLLAEQQHEGNQKKAMKPEKTTRIAKMVNDEADEDGLAQVYAALPSDLMGPGSKFEAERRTYQEGVLKSNQVLPAESVTANVPEKPAKAKRASKIKESKQQMKTLRQTTFTQSQRSANLFENAKKVLKLVQRGKVKPQGLSQHADGSSQAELTSQSFHRVDGTFLKQSQAKLNFDNLIKTQIVNKGTHLLSPQTDKAATKELNQHK